eukprot:TRINITY_DN5215_c0_g1_i9.p1 TRINITY_DN5215_c0_g1~~TRINITY_DN5215_c0_g1_i9.p1  ORF type:complete len:379 (+),score=163.53 TRINITY_DN5215_c0_g1_i9:46-1182(+)
MDSRLAALLLLCLLGFASAQDKVNLEETEDDNKDENVALAVCVSLGAGLATSIGGATPFFPLLGKVSQPKILAGSLAIASGVMLYVSFVEIFVKANDAITLGTGGSGKKLTEKNDEGVWETEKLGFVYPGEKLPNLYTTLTFFGGCIVVMLLHKLVHFISPVTEELDNPDVIAEHERAAAAAADEEVPPNGPTPPDSASGVEPMDTETPDTPTEGAPVVMDSKQQKALHKMGLLAALALGLHNFPEGFATFIATLEEPSLGLGLGVAIAIHNIPEGICVAMPVYYATGSKWKAFGWAFLSGLSEPVGGILGWLALRSIFTDLVFGIVFGMVGGMMVWIVLSELLPTAYNHDEKKNIVGPCMFAGMIIISASLIAFSFA